MAIRWSSSPPVIIQKSGLIKKPIRRFLMLQHSQSAVRKTPTLQIRSSLRNKVFEDRSTGIVCYRDDKGEIICEGYDEGPRIHQGFSRTDCQLRDAEIIQLLQQNWVQIVRGGGGGEKGVAVQDVNWNNNNNNNGFNTFC